MTQNEIDCFLAICRYKNGNRAAESLFITQSSLSTRLLTLERELGGKLFERKKGAREMSLTPEGAEFYKLALKYNEITEKMANVFSKPEQMLRVSSINSLATYLLPEVCEKFMSEYPQINLEIQDMELFAAVQSIKNGTTDLSFTCGKINDALLTEVAVFSEPMVIICKKDSPYPDKVPLSSLSSSCEVYNEWSEDYGKWHRAAFEGKEKPKLKVAIMTNLKDFFESENSWAIVPLSVADGLSKETEIRIIFPDFEIPNRIIYRITANNSKCSKIIGQFCRCFENTLKTREKIICL